MYEQKRNCLRCGTEMNYAFTENLQLGKTSWIFGDWPNLLAGALRVEIYCCPSCGKLEFAAAGDENSDTSGQIPQVVCPNCGQQHDFDYPRCPYCKHVN